MHPLIHPFRAVIGGMSSRPVSSFLPSLSGGDPGDRAVTCQKLYLLDLCHLGREDNQGHPIFCVPSSGGLFGLGEQVEMGDLSPFSEDT